MPFTTRTPTYLTSEQRHALTEIPADLFDREIARYFTFTQKDLDLIKSRRRLHNRLVFLCRQIKCTFLRQLVGTGGIIVRPIWIELQ